MSGQFLRLTPVQTVQARPPGCRIKSYLYHTVRGKGKIVTISVSKSQRWVRSGMAMSKKISSLVGICLGVASSIMGCSGVRMLLMACTSATVIVMSVCSMGGHECYDSASIYFSLTDGTCLNNRHLVGLACMTWTGVS